MVLCGAKQLPALETLESHAVSCRTCNCRPAACMEQVWRTTWQAALLRRLRCFSRQQHWRTSYSRRPWSQLLKELQMQPPASCACSLTCQWLASSNSRGAFMRHWKQSRQPQTWTVLQQPRILMPSHRSCKDTTRIDDLGITGVSSFHESMPNNWSFAFRATCGQTYHGEDVSRQLVCRCRCC